MRQSSFFTAIQTRPRRLGVIAPRVLAFCTAGGLLPVSLADVIHVPEDQPTIQAGIDVASDGDVVLIAAGTYQPDATIDTLGKAITVQGAVDASGLPTTIVDGQGERRGLQVVNEEGAATIFENLLVTRGQASSGGGMFIEDSGPTLANCRFENNVASASNNSMGGGIYVSNGDPTLNDCVFKENVSNADGGSTATALGGGFHSALGSSPTLNGCVFEDNSVLSTRESRGGGLSASGGELSLADCVFKGNRSTLRKDAVAFGNSYGGGLYQSGSDTTINGCLFEENLVSGGGASHGGGLCAGGDDLILIDTTFRANTSIMVDQTSSTYIPSAGGGLYFLGFNDYLGIEGCVFEENAADTGAGLYTRAESTVVMAGVFQGNRALDRHGAISTNENITLIDTILCGNVPNQISSTFIDGGGNCVRNVCIDGDDPSDCGDVGTDLALAVPGEYPNLALAIDAAAPGAVIEVAAGTHPSEAPLDTLGKALTIRGEVNASGRAATIIDGQQTGTVFFVRGSDLDEIVFENLLITGGQARNGGGINADSGRLSLVNCGLNGNSAILSGGGLRVGSAASVSLTSCSLSENTASDIDSLGGGGGGVHCIFGTVYMVGTSLCGNLPDQVRGEFIDGGENCLAVSCTDADGDGVADNCVDDGPDILQVPSEYSTISAAVAAAGIGDIVEIGAGVHPLQERIELGGQRITIRGIPGKDGRPATTIDGTGLDFSLFISGGDGDTVIENLRFIGSGGRLLTGSPSLINCVFEGIESSRAALYCEYASPTLRNCVFENNRGTGYGGGMTCRRPTSPTLVDCVFRNNVSRRGGGLYGWFGASPVLSGCVFEGNSATTGNGSYGGQGGGMYCDGGSPVLTDCRFQDNTTIGSIDNDFDNGGGGLYFEDASPSLIGCTFFGNSSGTGGGASLIRCDSILAGCVFESNRAEYNDVGDGSGGGIQASEYESTLTLSDCVFVGNTARFGAGLRNAGPRLSIQGCVFQSNIAELTSGGMAFYSQVDGVKMTETIFCGNQPNQISSYFFVDDGDNCFRNLCIDHDGDGVADCGEVETDLELSVPDEYPTIAHALDAAAPGAVIDVAAGTYRTEATLATLGKTLLIRGSTDEHGDPTTIIDGQGEHTVFYVEGPEGITTSFENLVITGGSGFYGGGMSDFSPGALSVVNSVFSGNEGSVGGGLYAITNTFSQGNGPKTLIDCVFEGNWSASSGGGVYGHGLIIIDSVITGNTAASSLGLRGGGLYIQDSTLTGTVVCGNTPDQIQGFTNTTDTSCISEICIDCEACGGDFNGDFEVDGADLSILMVAWGECERCSADLNGNGTVDIEDLGLLMAAWGRCWD